MWKLAALNGTRKVFSTLSRPWGTEFHRFVCQIPKSVEARDRKENNCAKTRKLQNSQPNIQSMDVLENTDGNADNPFSTNTDTKIPSEYFSFFFPPSKNMKKFISQIL
ncbi:hypothetical protein NPIL_487761 [Nephila pilipes]|uniref:Uncharacterized protein n=1 Tax=Nephila pilipes TaxID=299642 RepID=A0A8X6U5S9_NEPPI|nr:hypothetical protein NPIL_487761 [Nephila pilipes]